jgi:hypothetical protein
MLVGAILVMSVLSLPQKYQLTTTLVANTQQHSTTTLNITLPPEVAEELATRAVVECCC